MHYEWKLIKTIIAFKEDINLVNFFFKLQQESLSGNFICKSSKPGISLN